MADNGLWAKLWYDALSDQHLDDLDIADFGRWCKLIAYTKKHGEAGKITIKSPARALISAMQLQSFNDIQNVIKKFPNINVTCNDSKTLHVRFDPKKWKRYQGDWSGDRVKKHRAKKQAKCNGHVTTTEVDVEVDSEVEVKVEKDKTKEGRVREPRRTVQIILNEYLNAMPNHDGDTDVIEALKLWIAFRKEHRYTLKPGFVADQAKDMNELTDTVLIAAITKSRKNGYQGFFPDKVKLSAQDKANQESADRAQAIDEWAHKED